MKITRTQLKKLIKEELEKALSEDSKVVDTGTGRESRLQNWCVGYKDGDETKHTSVPADSAGVAEREVKKRHKLSDDDIVSSKEGKC